MERRRSFGTATQIYRGCDGGTSRAVFRYLFYANLTPMKTPQAAAIYARISSDVTGEGLGVQRQLEDCRKLAADRGWIVAEEYTDNDISAFRGKERPSYSRMLTDIADGRRDAVIVYNLDRLTRQPIQLEQFSQVCEGAGVDQVATVTTDINLGTDDGLFTARILAAVAAKESARKSERLKRKARQNAEDGKPGGGKLRPFGYESDKVTVRESEATLIRDLAARLIAGESCRSLAAWMNEQEIPSSTGVPWRTNSVRAMLRSGRIAGLRTHHGEVVAPAVWPAIITPALREQILATFESRQISGRRSARRYLLSGLLRCGKCGNRLFSSARGNRRRYVCMSGVDHLGCGKLTVVAAPVEEWIAEAVLLRLDTPAMADAIAGRVSADQRQTVLVSELEADRAQMKELAGMWSQRQISSAEWKSAREPIEARIITSERQIGQLTGTSTLEGLIGNGDKLRASWESLNLDRQTAIIRAVLDYGTIMPGVSGARTVDPARIVPTWRL